MAQKMMISAEYTTLLVDCQSRIFAYILSLVGDSDLSRDILQDTNQTLLSKSEQFELGSNFIAWAFSIARYEVLRARDRHVRRREVIFDEQMMGQLGQAVEQHAEHMESEIRVLRQCMDELDERGRAVIDARYFENVAVKDIAPRLGLSANAVSQVLHRVRIVLMGCVRKKRAAMEGSP